MSGDVYDGLQDQLTPEQRSDRRQRMIFVVVVGVAIAAAALWYALGPPAALLPSPRPSDVAAISGISDSTSAAIDSSLSMLPRTVVFPLASLSAAQMPGLYDSLLAIAQSQRILHIDIDSTWIEGRVTWVTKDAFALSDYIGGRIARAADGTERYERLAGWEPPITAGAQ